MPFNGPQCPQVLCQEPIVALESGPQYRFSLRAYLGQCAVSPSVARDGPGLQAVSTKGVECEVSYEDRGVFKNTCTPKRRPQHKTPLRGEEIRLLFSDLKETDRVLQTLRNDRVAHEFARGSLTMGPRDEPMERIDRTRRRRNVFGDFGIAPDQDRETGCIGECNFTQRDECPLEDGQSVAPAIVDLKSMDSDGADCRMPRRTGTTKSQSVNGSCFEMERDEM